MPSKTTMEDVFRRANRNIELWKGKPINTYSTALTNAHNSFKKTLADQKKVDDLQAEIVFLIGFVVAGTLLSSGVAAVAGAYFADKAVAGRVAGLVSKIKQSTTLNNITTLANTGLPRKLINQFVTEFRTLGKTIGKQQLIGKSATTQLPTSYPKTVADIKGLLLLDVTDTFQEIYDLADLLDKSPGLSANEKSAAADWLMGLPFMVADVPDIRTEQRKLETVIELTFLLNYILDMDKMVTTEYFLAPSTHNALANENMFYSRSSSQPITGSYRAGTYPVPKDSPGDDLVFATSQKIEYSDPGNIVARRINNLLKQTPIAAGQPDFMVDDSWFTNEMGKEQIIKAENYLVKLMNVNLVKAASSFR